MPPRTRHHGRLVVYLVSCALFLVCAFGAVLLARGYAFDFRHLSLYKAGLVALVSTPSGAGITINGAARSERTDARLKLKPGSYDITVSRPDTIPWEKHEQLDPGEAVIEENILLFSRHPERKQLAAEGVTNFVLSPNRSAAAMLQRTPEGAALTIGTIPGGTAGRAVSLPAAYQAPKSLTFSSDGSHILISTDAETTVSPVNNPAGTKVAGGGRVVFAPGRDDLLITEAGGQLVSVAIDTGAKELLLTPVTAWTTSSGSLYAVTADGKLHRREVRGDSDRIIETKSPVIELRGQPDADTVYALDNRRTLYLLDGDRLHTVAETVSHYNDNLSGQIVSYLSNHELWVWKRSTREAKLVTRFAELPTEIAPLADGYYVLYVKQRELHAIATDGSNDQVLAASGPGPLTLTDTSNVLLIDSATGALDLVRLVAR